MSSKEGVFWDTVLLPLSSEEGTSRCVFLGSKEVGLKGETR